MKFKTHIINEVAAQNEALLGYLGQAGFLLKTDNGKLIAIDWYLSDAAERLFGFKRMIPAIIQPEELQVDYYLSTHSHVDHLDPDILPVIAACEKTFFIGSPDCETIYQQNGIRKERYHILNTGNRYESTDLSVRAIYSDHGALVPDALGLLIEMKGIKVFHTGDTAFVPEKTAASLQTEIDVLIAPINAQYGNMNAREACQLANILKPKMLIACHFWMFLEHVGEDGVGDPATFMREAAYLSKSITPLVLAPGEIIRINP